MEFKKLLALISAFHFSSAQLSSHFITLKVDHFNTIDRRTFEGRYFSNYKHYSAGGPVFVFIGGGNENHEDFITRGAVFDLASESNGALYALEHRYFGQSRPTSDTSVQNLAWLNIHQALGDISSFLNFLRQMHENPKVVLWGRGYGAALAIWARQRFPHLVDAVWASSPYLNSILENPAFMENTGETIRSVGGNSCYQVIENTYKGFEEAFQNRNVSWIEKRFKLCYPIDLDTEAEVSRFFFGFAGEIGFEFLSNAKVSDIRRKCAIMTSGNPSENDIEAFARWYIDDFRRDAECIQLNNTAQMAIYQPVEWDGISTFDGRRQNFWLQCTSLGQFATSASENQPFGSNFGFEWFNYLCQNNLDVDLFTKDFMERSINQTNENFGGLNLSEVFNVFITQGELDPRRTLSPTKDFNRNSHVIVMPSQSFSKDLGPFAEQTEPIIIFAQRKAKEYILRWIQ